MRLLSVAALAASLLAGSALWLAHEARGDERPTEVRTVRETSAPNPPDSNQQPDPRTPAESIAEGLRWLASTQGADGGWGQDGGATSYVRQGENLETTGNDLANTAVAALAFLHGGSTPSSGAYKEELRSAVEFVLRGVEQAPEEGLALKTVTGSQIQRKLGPYIDTFLTSRLLSELDGETGDAALDRRVREALEVCVRKIEAHQQDDGSWNLSGGWAPILGTSLASQSLDVARAKGFEVNETVLAKVDEYTETVAQASTGTGSGGGVGSGAGRGVGVVGGVPGGVAGGSAGGVIGGIVRGAPTAGLASEASAGVALYRDAQILEQLSRTEEDREANKREIAQVVDKLGDARFQAGYGSMGGEEFFSYLNISDSLKRSGGEPWESWNGQIQTKLVRLQNEDGSWAGHHCITGRVAVTSAAVLTLAKGQS